jgi:hypothetical protein
MALPYPGQGSPSPATALPNRIPTPVGAVTAPIPVSVNVTNPAIGLRVKATATPTSQETHIRNQVNLPQPPAIGQPNYTPNPAPIGVSPHFETPTENWTWAYGQGGGGQGDGGA